MVSTHPEWQFQPEERMAILESDKCRWALQARSPAREPAWCFVVNGRSGAGVSFLFLGSKSDQSLWFTRQQVGNTSECPCELQLQPPVVSSMLLLVTLMQRDSMKLITSQRVGIGGWLCQRQEKCMLQRQVQDSRNPMIFLIIYWKGGV